MSLFDRATGEMIVITVRAGTAVEMVFEHAERFLVQKGNE